MLSCPDAIAIAVFIHTSEVSPSSLEVHLQAWAQLCPILPVAAGQRRGVALQRGPVPPSQAGAQQLDAADCRSAVIRCKAKALFWRSPSHLMVLCAVFVQLFFFVQVAGLDRARPQGFGYGQEPLSRAVSAWLADEFYTTLCSSFPTIPGHAFVAVLWQCQGKQHQTPGSSQDAGHQWFLLNPVSLTLSKKEIRLFWHDLLLTNP